MLLVKFPTVLVLHFILVLSVDVWIQAFTECTSALRRIMPFLGNSFWSCDALSSFLEEKDSVEAKILQGLFHSWETNWALLLSLSPYLCFAHTWCVYTQNMTNKPRIWFQQGKNCILMKSYDIPSEDTPSGINTNWAGSPETSSSLHSDSENNEEGYLQFRCWRI